MQENKYYSYNIGELAKGCQYCVKGEKLVIFITGLCPRNCYFCPVSEQKFQKDVTFANERQINNSDDLIKEAELMKAKGAGITGGDPLVKIDRTVRFIKKLKSKFGNKFHIHLYTSLRLVSEDNLQKLSQAGLDEIRFHLDLNSEQAWNKLELARKFPWQVGVEIPLIPGKDKNSKKMIDFIVDKVDFLNLNELEVADNKQSKLLEMNFKVKDQLSYGVEGSVELGFKLIDYVKEKNYKLNVHLCTAKLKDATQLAERIKREAKHSHHKFDIVDKEGMLTRGALYLEDLKPGFGYREKLAEIDKSEFVEKLEPLFEKVKKKLKLKDDDILLDQDKPRILLSKKNLKKNRNKFANFGLLPAIVVEYPTADQLEIEVEFLD